VPVAPQLAHGGMAGVSALTQAGAQREILLENQGLKTTRF